MADTRALIEQYYSALNSDDLPGLLALLSDDVVHDVNQSHREDGKLAFRAAFEHRRAHYDEQMVDRVICINEDGSRAATEYRMQGHYLATEDGLPRATGQAYDLQAGAFFEIKNGEIKRVTSYCNRQEWINQVSPLHDQS
ncbi:isopropylmalate/homocitrate/citramalate synthase [Litorivicinus lipolyticus]|uniref:Isopropylmalate/homocitrate/citramalate synthase n=1 Tax=Litorivicinus lipolyticus TaxID=418701 RepID=A0A5Q2QDL4_9GAMM|nr:ketosteroid isomerase-related protein [Litorivicinus lipolyticus]QGG80087.1 isopropylmalate/homocitrate/citramalate synthase [Litorivicinus lipolyticus]